jgi:hypothetical protein
VPCGVKANIAPMLVTREGSADAGVFSTSNIH